MFGRLLAALTLVTLAELALLIPLGRAIGFAWTFALVLLTAVIGAQLLRREGARTMQRFNGDLAAGRAPNDAILDGLCILVAGAFLLTPGLLTDLAGFLLLIPAARAPLKRIIEKRVRRAIDAGSVRVAGAGFDPYSAAGASVRHRRGPTIDVTPDQRTGAGEDAARSRRASSRGTGSPPRDRESSPVYADGDVIDVRPGTP